MRIRTLKELCEEKETEPLEPWTPYRNLRLPVKKEFGMTYVRAYADAVRNHIFKVGHLTPTEPTKVELTFYLKSPLGTPDIDNLVKEVLDHLFGSDYDNRVTTLIAKKRKGEPTIEVNISKDEDFLPKYPKSRKDFEPDIEKES